MSDHHTKPGSPGDILEHHGVKGMKWGVRKKENTSGRGTQPQLDKQRELTDRGQRRVEKFMKRADVSKTKMSELTLRNEELSGSRNPIKLYERQVNKESIKQLDKDQQRALKDAEAVKKGKLTSTEKKLIIGGVAVTAIVAAGLVARGQQSGALNSYKLLAEARLGGKKAPFDLNPKLARKMSPKELLDEVARPVNPLYSKPGGHMNCRRSTFAYELRRRGFDVHATTSALGWGQSESGVINATTPGSKKFYRSLSMSKTVMEKGTSAVARGDTRTNPVTKILLGGLKRTDPAASNFGSKQVFEALAKQPDGSRGEVLFKFPSFGHSMAYEIVGGKPHVFDTQKGVFHDLTQTVEGKWGDFHGAEITRLDNVDLDLDFLTRWATNN